MKVQTQSSEALLSYYMIMLHYTQRYFILYDGNKFKLILMAYIFPSNWRTLIKPHFDMQTELMKLSLNFTSVKFKQKITMLKTVKNSDEHTQYNQDVKIGNKTV